MENESLFKKVEKCYKKRWEKNINKLLKKYSNIDLSNPTLKDMEKLVYKDYCFESKKWKCCNHQSRVLVNAKNSMSEKLLKNLSVLIKSKDFEDLHGKVSELTDSVGGIGEVTIYDIATRYAYASGIKKLQSSKYVYLHSKLKKSATVLFGLNNFENNKIKKEKFNSTLSADHLENLLCICNKCIIGDEKIEKNKNCFTAGCTKTKNTGC